MALKLAKQKQILLAGYSIFKTTLKVDRLHVILALFGILSSSLLPFVLAWLFNEVINTVVAVANAELVIDNLLRVLIIFGIARVLLMLSYNLISYSENRLRLSLEEYFNFMINSKLTSLDIQNLEDPKFVDLKTKATDSYSWRPQSFFSNLIYTIQNIIQILASFAIILSLNPLWFVVIIISFLPSLYVNIKFSDQQWSIWDTDTETRRKYGYLSWMLGYKYALMEIRLFKAESFFLNRLMNLLRSYLKRNKALELNRFIYTSVFNFLPIAASVSLLIDLAYKASHRIINIGLLSFYASTLDEFGNALNSFVRNLSKSYEHSIFIIDMFKFLNYENKIYFKDKGVTIKQKGPFKIEFKNVSFSYPESDRPVFKDFNLVINPKENIALIGENGAGKTSLIKLLVKFYEPQKGKILINGIDLKKINPGFWFDNIGILTQDFVHYDFTVRENISLSRLEKTGDDEYLKRSAEQANALEFIQSLKLKFDQQLGKEYSKGEELSGGQWQRLALARAFFKDAPILILDEPTSAIDAKAEAEIFEKLHSFMNDKTVIFISHRFSTVRNADRIVVLEEGKIIQDGTHKQLIRHKGKYKSMFEQQAKGYQA